MPLSEKQRKHLRGLGHSLEPVIRIGQHGLTAALVAETERALHDHELIKAKVHGADREARDALIAELAARTGGTLVQRIGNVGLLYKPRADMPRILLPGE
jgi:RNA-binding protein